MSDQYDMIVIGAGISGLVMAHYCRKAGMKVLVVEKEERSGGCFHSVAIEDADRPFWLEMGTHTCFNSYGRLLDVMQDLGLAQHLQAREKLPYRLLVDKALHSILSRLHFFELFTHAWRLFSLKKEGKSVAEYYQSLVGPKNYAEVFQHAFNAVVCQQAGNVPADMLFRKRPRNKEVMRSFTMPAGLQQIIAELESRVECKKGLDIQTISHDEQGFCINTADNSYQSRMLTCATPVRVASALLADNFPAISQQLGQIGEVAIETVGVVVNKDDLSLEKVAGIIVANGDFYSAVSRDIVDHPDYRGLTFHFRPGLLSDEEKMKKICELLGIPPSKLQYIFNKANRLPAPDMGHHQLIRDIDAKLAGQPLALVGNYFEGVAVEDCLARVGSEFLRLSPSAC
jgi:protoporphyrinogen oxidase